MSEINDDGADFPNEEVDGDEKDPDSDEFAVEDGSEADVMSPISPKDVIGGSPV